METKNRICAMCGRPKAPMDGGLESDSGKFVCFDCLRKEYVVDCEPSPETEGSDCYPARSGGKVRDLRRQCVFTIRGTTRFPGRDSTVGAFLDEQDRMARTVKGWDPSCDHWDVKGDFEVSVLDEDLWNFYGILRRHGLKEIREVLCDWRPPSEDRRAYINRLAEDSLEYRTQFREGAISFDMAWNAI